MANFKRLRHGNRVHFFSLRFKKDEICTYDPHWFLFSDVMKLAKKHNIIIEYVGTTKNKDLYHETNGYGFMIVDFPGLKTEPPPERVFFDINELVC